MTNKKPTKIIRNMKRVSEELYVPVKRREQKIKCKWGFVTVWTASCMVMFNEALDASCSRSVGTRCVRHCPMANWPRHAKFFYNKEGCKQRGVMSTRKGRSSNEISTTNGRDTIKKVHDIFSFPLLSFHPSLYYHYFPFAPFLGASTIIHSVTLISFPFQLFSAPTLVNSFFLSPPLCFYKTVINFIAIFTR